MGLERIKRARGYLMKVSKDFMTDSARSTQ